ncbi:DUF493 family protein [Pseudomarimonas arenosa]|uniref:DUF493 family protein n=1 Tax=Pseudomarimonas arenosa TaxID=2774145 RepID=A0AAW3ZHB7_9GAMM|nr:DUF493 family protein [Pseudomarimonas arenosa]MBD8525483.1 DUF493 family protein [Pseudomarimonas arenosa]
MAEQSEDNRGFRFPGVFEISAMGPADADLELRVPALLSAAGLRLVADSLRQRPSSKGNYVSVHISFHADDRQQYELAHSCLRACPDVKWTL